MTDIIKKKANSTKEKTDEQNTEQKFVMATKEQLLALQKYFNDRYCNSRKD